MKKVQLYFTGCLLLFAQVLFGQSPEELLLSGKKRKAQGDCQTAQSYFLKAISADRTMGWAYFESGWCYNELMKFDSALVQLKQAAVLLPQDIKVLYETGFAYYNLDSTDQALTSYRKVLGADSSHALANMGVGDIYREKKNNIREALKWYRRAADKEGESKKANYWAGWCANELKDFSAAIPYLQKVIRLDSTDRLPFAELGYSYYSLGKYEEAISYLKTAAAAEPRIETALYYIGLCYVRTGQKQEAIKKYNELTLTESKLAPGLLAEIQSMQ